MFLNKQTTLAAVVAALTTTLGYSAQTQSFEVHDQEKRLPMDEGVWSYQGNHFECNMELPMRGVGKLKLAHAAGSSLYLGYYPFEKRSQTIAIAWAAAPWHEKANGHFYALADASTHFVLGDENTKNLMHALDEGGWFLLVEGNRSISVPTLGWSIYAPEFRQCVSGLLPLSEAQVRDGVIFYRMGQRVLRPEQVEAINDIAETVKALPDVRKILVDSYTDKTGSRLTNLQLSRERSADVVSALVSAGVDRSMIEQRSHGERYPSSDNLTRQSQDMSRKVTIRVIREKNDIRVNN